MVLRDSLFSQLTPVEALLLQSRLKSGYSHAGILFDHGRAYDAVNLRRELLEILAYLG